jgi:hypothetical protein
MYRRGREGFVQWMGAWRHLKENQCILEKWWLRAGKVVAESLEEPEWKPVHKGKGGAESLQAPT